MTVASYLDHNAVRTYPIPSGVQTMDAYSIKVTSPKSSPHWIQPFQARVAQINETSGNSIEHNTSVGVFDFSGPIEIAITYHAAVRTGVVRPYSYGIRPQITNNTIQFSLQQPCNLLFMNPIETKVTRVNDPDVLYFGPGVNNGTAAITNGTLYVPSGKTVYVAGGGLLDAQVVFQNVSNSAIKGRGILAAKSSGAVLIESSSNITVEDVVILNPNGYAVTAGMSQGINILGIRAFSSRGNGDGIDLFCCRDALIDGIFMRNSDDNIALYQHRWAYYGDSSNITVQNSALWADYAHPINIGTHGNTPHPEVMDGVTIRNIDILNHHEPQIAYQGCIAINAGDGNLIQNVHIENIRVEDFQLGQLVNFRVMYNTKYNTSPGRGIRNVVVKDLIYEGTHASPSLLLGYDRQRPITNITFVNLQINGKMIDDNMKKPSWYSSADFVPLFANEHVHNLSFVSN
ncbi:unnamed protein product [Penicillium viridicatum]